MGASHSNQSTTYTLKSDGNIVRVSGSADNFNNSPIVKVEQLQRGSLRSAVRKFFARCSFSPGWIRYEQILQNIAGTFDVKLIDLVIFNPLSPVPF